MSKRFKSDTIKRKMSGRGWNRTDFSKVAGDRKGKKIITVTKMN
jgi:hypothetical protein